MVAGRAIVRLIGPLLALATLTVGADAGVAPAEGAGSAWRQAGEKTRVPPNSKAVVWALVAFMIGGAPNVIVRSGRLRAPPRVPGTPSLWAGPTAGWRTWPEER